MLDWIKVEDKAPPKDETILAAHIRDKDLYWIASIWWDDEFNKWNCDFTDEEFDNRGFHSFNYWAKIT